MDVEPVSGVGQPRSGCPQQGSIKEALALIASQPKRRRTRQEIDEARGNLALMNDRVFFRTFSGNRNNRTITEIVNALRKIHGAGSIPPIERTNVQDVSLKDVLGRGMVGDLVGEGCLINIAVEVQKGSQAGYAVRGTITSGNAMRLQFNAGDDFADAPDVIGVNILGFGLPELAGRRMFCSRIVRAEYESREAFLEDKYSDYYIEMPKTAHFTKGDLPGEYHDLWDICCIFKAKIKEHEEVIRMQAIANPAALELSKEVRKAVAPSEFVSETLDRKSELEQLRVFMERHVERQVKKATAEAAKKASEEAAKKATDEAAKKVAEATKKAAETARSAEQKGKEEMLILAIRNLVSKEIIETMRQSAGITEARLNELREQAQKASFPAAHEA